MYNCFSHRLCTNIKINHNWTRRYEVPYTEIDLLTGEKKASKSETRLETTTININAYDSKYKIYMLPVKLFENYTIAIDCYQGVELFCGFYNETFDNSNKARDLLERTYTKVSKALFNQPFIYDKLCVEYWNWQAENTIDGDNNSLFKTENKILRSEITMRERELKLFIKVPATNTSSITILEGDYRNFNDVLYKLDGEGWQYQTNSTNINFETNKTYKDSKLPDINSREFKPISKLQLLALNTGISYPFADRLIEYLIMNVILPNDTTPDNIKRLQKVMEDCGYNFQVKGIWEPKMQMILYDYLMNHGKFIAEPALDEEGTQKYNNKTGKPIYKVTSKRKGNLCQMGQKMRSDFYDVLGFVDKDAERLYTSWTTEETDRLDKNGKPKYQVIIKNTLENVDIYSNLYNN